MRTYFNDCKIQLASGCLSIAWPVIVPLGAILVGYQKRCKDALNFSLKNTQMEKNCDLFMPC